MSALLHSLRFRLTLWYTLALALVLTLSGLLTYFTVRYQLLGHHDVPLKDAAAEVRRVLSQEQDCRDLTLPQRDQLDRVGYVVLFHEAEGELRVFYRSPDSARWELPLEAHVARSLTPGDGWFQTLTAGTKLVRMYSEAYRSRAGRRGLLHVVQSLGDVPLPLTTLRLTLLVMAPLSVLVSALVGYWLAGRALAPVDEVTCLAREIGAGNLSRRLPLPKTSDEIGRLVETLNQMIARLETSFEAMKRFTADASHELRGPLATMRGAIDVALSRRREAPEYRAVLASVGEDVDRLRSITEDLLVLARADAGRLKLEETPVRLDLVMAEVVESFQARVEGTEVELRALCETPVVMRGDERWLRQLAFNLLDNAIKFSSALPSAGKIRPVTVEVGGTDHAASLLVTDSGPGIPEKDIGRIFERFYRVDDARTYRGGAAGCGLGLSISAWIVEAHGGRIAAQNRPEGGCLVYVSFPSPPS